MIFIRCLRWFYALFLRICNLWPADCGLSRFLSALFAGAVLFSVRAAGEKGFAVLRIIASSAREGIQISVVYKKSERYRPDFLYIEIAEAR